MVSYQNSEEQLAETLDFYSHGEEQRPANLLSCCHYLNVAEPTMEILPSNFGSGEMKFQTFWATPVSFALLSFVIWMFYQRIALICKLSKMSLSPIRIMNHSFSYLIAILKGQIGNL